MLFGWSEHEPSAELVGDPVHGDIDNRSPFSYFLRDDHGSEILPFPVRNYARAICLAACRDNSGGNIYHGFSLGVQNEDFLACLGPLCVREACAFHKGYPDSRHLVCE